MLPTILVSHFPALLHQLYIIKIIKIQIFLSKVEILWIQIFLWAKSEVEIEIKLRNLACSWGEKQHTMIVEIGELC